MKGLVVFAVHHIKVIHEAFFEDALRSALGRVRVDRYSLLPVELMLAFKLDESFNSMRWSFIIVVKVLEDFLWRSGVALLEEGHCLSGVEVHY